MAGNMENGAQGPGLGAGPQRQCKRRAVAVALLAAGMGGMAAITAITAAVAAQAQATATGEVRRVDAQAGTVALRHGEIKALGLPAMTLVYHAAPTLLRGIKPGDKVRFTATRQEGRYVVTAIDRTLMP
jgi:Cu/Ag efflux protein CusF